MTATTSATINYTSPDGTWFIEGLVLYGHCTYAGTAPSWGYAGGDPGDPPEFEFDEAEVDGLGFVDPEWVREVIPEDVIYQAFIDGDGREPRPEDTYAIRASLRW